ncbi:C2H2-type zinc finger family protein [Actinidia rufa]|uniref:C2H2-type zinc finger family protein n=1 Tax=Actinidia rufa TaxID=165716 RepID=A0A7J0HCC9_9ERIC|nr:C2H2-type zinc finger family protein [Actinidia rufa]
MESAEEFTASNDHVPVLKGKRSKRQRPISTSTSSTTGGSGGDGVYFSIPSPTSSAEISTSADEDEDMANCLILLAQGRAPPPAEVAEGKIIKLNSLRLAAAGGKSGLYVYECKTCNRSFPSFQALGGHRASHKKPKTDAKPTIPPTPPEEKCELTKIPPPLPLTIANKSNKMHECSICGSEFSSGQALGGHMRRHRTAPTARAATSIESDDHYEKKRMILPLDLNLPAPLDQDDLHRDSKYPFFFNGPALVDCHY